MTPRLDQSPGLLAGPSVAPHGHTAPMANHHPAPPPPGLLGQDALHAQLGLNPLLAALPASLLNGETPNPRSRMLRHTLSVVPNTS